MLPSLPTTALAATLAPLPPARRASSSRLFASSTRRLQSKRVRLSSRARYVSGKQLGVWVQAWVQRYAWTAECTLAEQCRTKPKDQNSRQTAGAGRPSTHRSLRRRTTVITPPDSFHATSAAPTAPKPTASHLHVRAILQWHQKLSQPWLLEIESWSEQGQGQHSERNLLSVYTRYTPTWSVRHQELFCNTTQLTR